MEDEALPRLEALVAFSMRPNPSTTGDNVLSSPMHVHLVLTSRNSSVNCPTVLSRGPGLSLCWPRRHSPAAAVPMLLGAADSIRRPTVFGYQRLPLGLCQRWWMLTAVGAPSTGPTATPTRAALAGASSCGIRSQQSLSTSTRTYQSRSCVEDTEYRLFNSRYTVHRGGGAALAKVLASVSNNVAGRWEAWWWR